MQTFIASILVFGIIIAIHEFGHFSVAKLVGIRVDEFSVGMGPKIISKKGPETLYSLRAIPIGGYVKMAGEYYEEETEKDRVTSQDPRDFNNKTVLQRILVVLAGVFMNFLLAIVIFAFIAFSFGVPTGDTMITDVVKDSPAEKAGFMPGDQIVEIDGERIDRREDLDVIIKTRPNEEVNFVVLRAGKEISLNPILGENEEKLGFLGILGHGMTIQKQSFMDSVKHGFTETWKLVSFIFLSLKLLFNGNIGIDALSGPVGVVRVIDETAKVGIYPLLYLTGFMSANIGLLNLFPIPGLDGSKTLFLLYEGISGKPLDRKKEGLITTIGFAFLFGLFLIITFNDIIKLFGN